MFKKELEEVQTYLSPPLLHILIIVSDAAPHQYKAKLNGIKLITNNICLTARKLKYLHTSPYPLSAQVPTYSFTWCVFGIQVIGNCRLNSQLNPLRRAMCSDRVFEKRGTHRMTIKKRGGDTPISKKISVGCWNKKVKWRRKRKRWSAHQIELPLLYNFILTFVVFRARRLFLRLVNRVHMETPF